MKQQVIESPDKTRRAVVGGDKAVFYTRRSSAEAYCSPKQFWSQRYGNHEEAVEMATKWANEGGRVPQPRKRV